MGSWNGVELDGLVLTSQRITLRPWQPTDAEAVYVAAQDELMHRFLPLPDPYTRSDARAFVETFGDEGRSDGRGLGCAVVQTATGRVVGSAALRLPPDPGAKAAAGSDARRTRRTGEIGYWIAADARGSGYAGELSRTLAEWGLARGLQRVEIRCSVTNLASARSALGAGFRFESVHRQDLPTPDGLGDVATFARLGDDSGRPVRSVLPMLPATGLTDDTLTLRCLAPGDEAARYAELTDELTRRWALTDAVPSLAELASEAAGAALRWLVGPVAQFAMVDVASGQVAGSVQLRQAGPPHVGGIGYGVHPAFRGRGYTTRALRLLIPWAFDVAGFARLELGAKAGNVASQKAALAAGFEPDGVRRARLRNVDGGFSDEYRFALVNPRLVPEVS